MAAYQLFQLPKQLNISSSFTLSAGAKAYFYATTTSTPQDTYTTSALNVAHPNPVVADAAGVLPAIYLDPSLQYKLTLNTSADVLIYTVDPVNDQVLSQALIGQLLYPRTAAEIAASVTPTNLAYESGVFTRYNGTVASSAAANTAALQDALNSNQTVYINENGTHNFASTAITFNDNNRIVGRGKGTILKWNATGINIFRGLNATSTRRYRFGMRDLLLDNTARTNAGTVMLDLENLTLGTFENVEVQNVETGLRIDAGIGAFYNHFFSCGFLTCDTGIILSTLGNENIFVACRVGDVDAGVVIDDNSGNAFHGCAFEGITNIAIDIGNTAAALYTYFSKPRVEGAATGFRLDNADARSTTIVGPQFQTISIANFSGTGLDTAILSGELNSPELRANQYALGQGGLDNAQWALIKATATADVSVRNSTDSGFADWRASDIYAGRYLRVAGASSGAASTTTFGNGTASTVGAAGGASALPATPLGYIVCHVGATQVKIPYYNV